MLTETKDRVLFGSKKTLEDGGRGSFYHLDQRIRSSLKIKKNKTKPTDKKTDKQKMQGTNMKLSDH